jgi:rhamnopyranosyl-N-acetylglucosaminyl-diphospho-decaprenol beta-1,3/1,4-galactofuranosyltransferase
MVAEYHDIGDEHKADMSASTATNVAAVYATFNRRELALRCVEGLLNQTAPLSQIIVVDNGSTDGTAASFESHRNRGNVTLIPLTENIGNPGGIKVAMEHALSNGARWIWILDDDAMPHPQALEKLIAHATGEEAVFSSHVIDPETGDPSWPYLSLLKEERKLVSKKEELPEQVLFEVRGAWLGALVPRRLIEKAGLPNPGLFIRGEDEEYPARLKRAGCRFYCVKDSILEHPAAPKLIHFTLFGRHFFYEPGLPLWKAFYLVRNQTYVRREYGGGLFHGWLGAFGSALLFLLMGLVADDQPLKRLPLYLKASLDGLTGRLGKRTGP